jgi:hypothetical protein
MKQEEEYTNHITQSWKFAEKLASKLNASEHRALNIALVIFEKCISPYHYFLQNGSEKPKPTSKQIKYANNLGIKNPETYTKEALSNKISEVLEGG